MDLIKQNKFISWVIAVLVVLNLSALTMVYIQSRKTPPAPLKEINNPIGSPVSLMQHEIGLSEDQAQKYQDMRKEHMEKIKEINDQVDASKLCIADEIFAKNPDEKKVDTLAAKIGMLQAKIEVMRFEHFRDLINICNNEQKEKLHPILRDVFGKKPPNDENNMKSPGRKGKNNSIMNIQDDQVSPPRDERTGPPSKEEKVNHYAERLSLNPGQIKKVNAILSNDEAKRESFKSKLNHGQHISDTDRNAMLKEEDESILSILNPEQKKEFEKMIINRGKR